MADGAGVKRKHVAWPAASDSRSPKRRVSPFLNTPIQKKEAKRRILRISLCKMRQIPYPESFLLRSVLINNLVRSLQDDLKHDKLWSRWDWTQDTIPNRSQDGSRDSARWSNQSSPNGTWTGGAHAHWLGDMAAGDAPMTASERERVSRDVTSCHDRLAETVDSLTSFDDVIVKDPLMAAAGQSDGYMATGADDVTGVTCNCADGRATTDTTSGLQAYPQTAAYTDHGGTLAGDVTSGVASCASTEKLPTSTGVCPAKSVSLPHLDSAYTTPEYACTLADSSTHGIGGGQLMPTARYSEASMTDKVSDVVGDKDLWTLSCLDYPEELSTTYLDMTSNSVCHVRNSDSTLLDSCIPDRHSTTSAIDVPSSTSGPSTSESFDVAKLGYNVGGELSPSGCLWNASNSYVDVINSPISCSTEAEHPEYVTSSLYNDQDRYSSQSLRDFDVIYNNLVSVLIGGN